VFSVALSAGAWPVVVVAVASSIVAVFFYVRFILLMFFTDREAAGAAAVTIPSPLTTSVIAVTAIATFVLGVVPGPVLDLVEHAGSFIR
jgi:NADH-quinone oxidoreductase subunit N